MRISIFSELFKLDLKDEINIIALAEYSIKKIVISPTLFFLGKDIKKDQDEIKAILKGYLMIILLQETEHFYRLLDKDNKVYINI